MLLGAVTGGAGRAHAVDTNRTNLGNDIGIRQTATGFKGKFKTCGLADL